MHLQIHFESWMQNNTRIASGLRVTKSRKHGSELGGNKARLYPCHCQDRSLKFKFNWFLVNCPTDTFVNRNQITYTFQYVPAVLIKGLNSRNACSIHFQLVICLLLSSRPLSSWRSGVILNQFKSKICFLENTSTIYRERCCCHFSWDTK